MNVVLEPRPNCLMTLSVELPSERVSKEWSNIAQTFQRKARVPGYRPGKAPQALVESRFAKDIKEELTSKLLRDSLSEAIRENNLRVLSVSEVENVEIAEDRTMRYRATVVTAPEFELPDYSSIRLKSPRKRLRRRPSPAGSISSGSHMRPTPRSKGAPS
jgi:trigger factor